MACSMLPRRRSIESKRVRPDLLGDSFQPPNAAVVVLGLRYRFGHGVYFSNGVRTIHARAITLFFLDGLIY